MPTTPEYQCFHQTHSDCSVNHRQHEQTSYCRASRPAAGYSKCPKPRTNPNEGARLRPTLRHQRRCLHADGREGMLAPTLLSLHGLTGPVRVNFRCPASVASGSVFLVCRGLSFSRCCCVVEPRLFRKRIRDGVLAIKGRLHNFLLLARRAPLRATRCRWRRVSLSVPSTLNPQAVEHVPRVAGKTFSAGRAAERCVCERTGPQRCSFGQACDAYRVVRVSIMIYNIILYYITLYSIIYYIIF